MWRQQQCLHSQSQRWQTKIKAKTWATNGNHCSSKVKSTFQKRKQQTVTKLHNNIPNHLPKSFWKQPRAASTPPLRNLSKKNSLASCQSGKQLIELQLSNTDRKTLFNTSRISSTTLKRHLIESDMRGRISGTLSSEATWPRDLARKPSSFLRGSLEDAEVDRWRTGWQMFVGYSLLAKPTSQPSQGAWMAI